jgi:proteasome, alpha subunit, bacterial type
VLIVADNASRTLSKISEIYDRIAFAAVGKYNEFQLLKVAGVRHADLKGYSYSREDVSAKELANAYAQTLGQIFTHEMKPYEVELLVAEVGADLDGDAMYHILYDGVVMDEQDHAVLGGNAESIRETLASQFERGMDLAAAVKLGARVLAPDGDPLGAEQLEVALLDRMRPRRAFRRLRNGELEQLLGTA